MILPKQTKSIAFKFAGVIFIPMVMVLGMSSSPFDFHFIHVVRGYRSLISQGTDYVAQYFL